MIPHINISNKYGYSVYHTSDLHGTHHDLEVPDVDIMIVSGDATNYRDMYRNEVEWKNFVEWYSEIPIPIKIYVPGNHDSFVFQMGKEARLDCQKGNIDLLIKESLKIGDLVIYGDPTTPRFGDWCFMAPRDKMHKHWGLIPEDTNILVTHGPPQGILDLTKDFDNKLKNVGCKSLMSSIQNLSDLFLNCFGHIHSSKNIQNNGVLFRDKVWYSNASAVRDGEMGVLYNQGVVFKI